MENSKKIYTLGSSTEEQGRLISQGKLYDDAKYLKQFLSLQSNILEVGCGSGANLWVANNVKHYTGVDISEEQIQKSILTADELGIKNASFFETTPKKLPFSDDLFDFTFCRLVLIHQVNPIIQLKEMKRVTSSGGRIVAIEPDVELYASSNLSLMKFFQARSRLVYQAGRGSIQVARNLLNLFSNIGLKEIQLIKHEIELTDREPEKLKLFQKNMLMLAKSVQDELIRENYLTLEDCVKAEYEADLIAKDGWLRQVLYISNGIKI